MRKLFVFIMILSTTLFISCGNKTNDGATENNKGMSLWKKRVKVRFNTI